ncbi:hypothetical protein DPMN_021771 [Dreissena polymorpha]|uniref:Uncharacterized protein n=1 Tax=Dreissena polymorpha TaxID=45954 RepID=A0A9D4NNC6_DREPO|nr:hypothetical protein DPMN_021769 [Dreissena polymorpha]KAH3897583.1 hypothetical protein DPMN_021771 [Dreissena polymorpha]
MYGIDTILRSGMTPQVPVNPRFCRRTPSVCAALLVRWPLASVILRRLLVCVLMVGMAVQEPSG